MEFRFGDSIAEQFARGHSFPAVLRELVQNEYDAGGATLEVVFGEDAVRVHGSGDIIDEKGWGRLSVVLATGDVPGSDDHVEPKKNGIGSKNFGLRSLFLLGDSIHVRSGGRRTVLDLRRGTYPRPLQDPDSAGFPGVEIYVPYRTEPNRTLPAFDMALEQDALGTIAEGLSSALMKLAAPGSAKSVERVTVESVRHRRTLSWEQRAESIPCKLRGVWAIRRAVALTDSASGDATRYEVEFGRAVRIPERFRGRDIPEYFTRRGRRVAVAVSMDTHRGRPKPGAVGAWYYPIGVPGHSTGTGVSISAPFDMDEDRSAILETTGSDWNRWLVDEAAALAMDLLTTDWWDRFGGDAYAALWPTDLERASDQRFAETIRTRLQTDPCWPTRIVKGKLRFAAASQMVVPSVPTLDGLLTAKRYAPMAALRRPGFAGALQAAGAKPFGISSLVRLRCAGADEKSLRTRLPSEVANFHYTDYTDALTGLSLHLRLTAALDSVERRLSKENREDLRCSPSTLSAAGTLEPAETLQRVPADIAEATLVTADRRLHPALLGSRLLKQSTQPYHPFRWAMDVAEKASAGTARDEERWALYSFIRSCRGRFPVHVRSRLSRAPVLRDVSGDWTAPVDLAQRRIPGRKDFGPVLRFAHREIESDRDLMRAFRLRDRLRASDLVAYARLVEREPERVESFEALLVSYRRLALTPEALKTLPGISCLRSSAGGVAAPRTLYIDSARLRSCLGPTAAFAVSSLPLAILTQLRCRTEPELSDILLHVDRIATEGSAPEAPDVLYAELVAALQRAGVSTLAHAERRILWTDVGWSRPVDTVLRTAAWRIPSGALPHPPSGAPALLAAYQRLGASVGPTERHWRALLLWFSEHCTRGTVLTSAHAQLVRTAYGQLGPAGGEFPNTACILLGRDQRLHPKQAALDRRFLIDDHPRLAAAIQAQALPIAFADASEANAFRFLGAVGVVSLREICGLPRVIAFGERPAPPRLRVDHIMGRLRDPSFPSAVAALVSNRVRRSSGVNAPRSVELERRLGRIERLRFVQQLTAEYRILRRAVRVPLRVKLEGESILLAEVRAEKDVLALVAQVIAEWLPGADAAEWTDSVLRLLLFDDREDMRSYLADRGVAWIPPRGTDRQGGRDDVEDALAEELGPLFRPASDPGDEPETAAQPAAPPARRPPPARPALPPLDQVHAMVIDPNGQPIPARREGGGGGGGGGGWDPVRDEARDREIGRRGEELVFLQELARVRARGFPEDRVVWTADREPGANHDICSVGPAGEQIWIEVKATTGRDGRFRWSRSEMELARQKRGRYFLVRVYAADSLAPVIKWFPDPVALLLEDRLRLDVAMLQAEVEGAGTVEECR